MHLKINIKYIWKLKLKIFVMVITKNKQLKLLCSIVTFDLHQFFGIRQPIVNVLRFKNTANLIKPCLAFTALFVFLCK